MNSLIASAIRQQNEIEGIKIGDDEVKLSLFTDDMILRMEKPERLHQKLLDLIHEFSKTIVYKINVHNQVHFYTPIMKQQKVKSRNRSHLQLYQEP